MGWPARAGRGGSGEVDQPLVLVGVGGVAAEPVTDLAGTVVVARARRHQAEVAGDGAQPLPRRRVVVLVVDLDAGQTRSHQTGQRLLVEAGRGVAAPRVGDHGDPAGAVDDVDHCGERGGVAVDVRRPTVAQEPLERLVAVGHLTQGHQGVGQVRATDRRAWSGSHGVRRRG